SLRVGKIFVDWSQNDDHKTTICVYSLRAKDRPTASTPVSWDEVAATLKKGKAEMLVFESDAVLKRAESLGDLFEPVLTRKQKLPSLDALEKAVATVMAGKPSTDTAASARAASKPARKPAPVTRMKTATPSP